MPPFSRPPALIRRRILAFSLSTVMPAAAHAQAPEPAAPESLRDTVPVVLTISGGISMGSYQSGVNWALVDFFRHSYHSQEFRDQYHVAPHRLVVATGASAGNVNALLSSLDWCAPYRPASEPAERSLFWSIWTGMGIGELFPNDAEGRRPARPGPDAYGVFRRDSVRRAYQGRIARRFAAAENADCSVALGITLTRVAPDSIPLNDRLHARAQRFASVFVVQAGGAGGRGMRVVAAPASVRTDPHLGRMIVPPTGPDGAVELPPLLALVEASSAFPLAFQPVLVNFYWPGALGPQGGCPAGAGGGCAEADTATFMDGGVFDNNPLPLAVGLYGHAGARPRLERYIFIDPDGVRADSSRAARAAEAPPRPESKGLAAVYALLDGAVPAARQYELHALARSMADSMRRRISITDRRHPIVSTHLGAFAGFLGRPFREFDFYVGMYDGLYFAAHDVLCRHPEGDTTVAECTGRELRRLLHDPRFGLSPYAKAVLVHLYGEEFRGQPLPQQDSARTRLVQVLAALDLALDSVRNHPPDCRTGSMIGSALCRDGFTEVVRRMRTRDVRRLTVGWRPAPGCRSEAPDCFHDREMNALIDDPERYLARLMSRVVDRVDNVERGLGRRGSHRGVALAGAVYHMGAGEPRRGMEKDPSSVPDTRGTWWRLMSHALPYYMGVGTGGGVEAGYRPSYYVGNGAALIFPVLPVHFSPTRDDTRKQLFAAYGAGLHLRVSGPFDVEGSYQAIRPYSHLTGAPVSTTEGAVLVADKLRVGFRYVLSDPGRFYPTARGLRKDGLSMTIGLVDLNGLIYWTGRLMVH